MFRLSHTSDHHGLIPGNFPSSTVMIVDSGDLFGNLTRGIADQEKKTQRAWFLENVEEYARRIGERLYVFIPGNHDYYDPTQDLIAAGVQTINLSHSQTAQEIMGVRFYGFPWIPYIAGEWNYEVQSREMSDRVRQIPPCDILVAHCPPYGICSDVEEGKGGGNGPLINWLNYECPKLPKFLLCGHMHASRGIGVFKRGEEHMIVSNAAEGMVHTFEIDI